MDKKMATDLLKLVLYIQGQVEHADKTTIFGILNTIEKKCRKLRGIYSYSEYKERY
tara:strand:+ start:496 stop:663 length:168 start_codon:yes stop_codon:yes gene_type:complete